MSRTFHLPQLPRNLAGVAIRLRAAPDREAPPPEPIPEPPAAPAAKVPRTSKAALAELEELDAEIEGAAADLRAALEGCLGPLATICGAEYRLKRLTKATRGPLRRRTKAYGGIAKTVLLLARAIRFADR